MLVMSKNEILVIKGEAFVYCEKSGAMVRIPFQDDCANVIEPKLGTGDDPK